jgi:hypothetical protein
MILFAAIFGHPAARISLKSTMFAFGAVALDQRSLAILAAGQS